MLTIMIGQLTLSNTKMVSKIQLSPEDRFNWEFDNQNKDWENKTMLTIVNRCFSIVQLVLWVYKYPILIRLNTIVVI